MGKINSRDKGARYSEEVWKPIVGYEGLYEVSNYGRIKSLPNCRRKTERLMSLDINNQHGYVQVHLSKNGKSRTHRVHKIVMEAFTDYRSQGYKSGYGIDHIDGDKTNNRLDNLQILSNADNVRKAHYVTGINYAGTKCIDLDTGEIFDTYQEASRAIGGRRGEMVRRVCVGERSHYRGHRYANYDDYVNGTIPTFKGRWTRKVSESLWGK